MQKKTRSLLEELESIGSNRDMTHVIESRAHNIITSAINLIELINKHYDKNTSEILERKLFSDETKVLFSKLKDLFVSHLKIP